jgi:hypothetical protein
MEVAEMARRLSLLGLLAAALAACASAPDPLGTFAGEETIEEQSTPLGGSALAQRRREMERAYGDLAQQRATLLDLHRRGDGNGVMLFGSFVEAYLSRHLAPLLRSEWQSRHPELAALDASLRLLEAELRVELRDPGRVQEGLDEAARRFAGRESLLVDWPVGEQTPLGAAIEALRKRKWRG